jgi:thymidylate synthase (FAD)
MKVTTVWKTPDGERLIAYMARVSNPANQTNEKYVPLIKYLIKHKHWSPFEMVNVCMEIECTRDIARQILRHRSFSFQEFCLSGDTDIYFAIPAKLKKGAYKPTYKIKIKDLYAKWSNPHVRDRIKNMHIKMFDEASNKLTTSHIKEVFKTGVKPIFEITLSDGKTIKTTKEHKFLTKEGFDTLENIVGLSMKNDRALMSNVKPVIGVNGVLWYQDKDTLLSMKQKSLFLGGGIKWIAKETQTNYNTIRKWLKKYDISYLKSESAKIFDPWNKNKNGYNLRSRTEDERRRQSELAKSRGVNHNWYRGGNSYKREPLNETDSRLFRESLNYTCQRCAKYGGVLDIHHKLPVSSHPEFTHDKNNWELLCRECHQNHHKAADMTGWQQMGAQQKKENAYVVKWVTIDKIRYVGEEETYDIEVDHPSHNYVANGIVVHNSQRYAVADGYELSEVRLQDEKNRQNSIPVQDREMMRFWQEQQQAVLKAATVAYENSLNAGVAREVARKVLPEGLTTSRMYMNGTLRSWLHYVDIRTGVETQKEHRDIALECEKQLRLHFPNVMEAYDNR